jgi:hypothetical protein
MNKKEEENKVLMQKLRTAKSKIESFEKLQIDASKDKATIFKY